MCGIAELFEEEMAVRLLRWLDCAHATTERHYAAYVEAIDAILIGPEQAKALRRASEPALDLMHEAAGRAGLVLARPEGFV